MATTGFLPLLSVCITIILIAPPDCFSLKRKGNKHVKSLKGYGSKLLVFACLSNPLFALGGQSFVNSHSFQLLVHLHSGPTLYSYDHFSVLFPKKTICPWGIPVGTLGLFPTMSLHLLVFVFVLICRTVVTIACDYMYTSTCA